MSAIFSTAPVSLAGMARSYDNCVPHCSIGYILSNRKYRP